MDRTPFLWWMQLMSSRILLQNVSQFLLCWRRWPFVTRYRFRSSLHGNHDLIRNLSWNQFLFVVCRCSPQKDFHSIIGWRIITLVRHDQKYNISWRWTHSEKQTCPRWRPAGACHRVCQCLVDDCARVHALAIKTSLNRILIKKLKSAHVFQMLAIKGLSLFFLVTTMTPVSLWH